MQSQESEHIGNIGYFELHYIPSEESLQVLTQRDDFKMKMDIPNSYEGEISDIREEIYSDIVNEHNNWMMEK